MNREDIIKLARESGAGLSTSAIPLEHPWVFLPDELERFAALVAAAEREACAKMVEDIEARCIAKDVDDPPLEHVAAIRARSKQ